MFGPITRGKKQKETPSDKIREQEETARVYAEFVRSFESANEDATKTFVRGGLIDPNNAGKVTVEPSSPTGKSKIYKPPKKALWVPPPSQSLQGKGKTAGGGQPPPPPPPTTPKPESKTKEIDAFLEEIKRKQQLTEERKTLSEAASKAQTDDERERIKQQLTNLDNATKGKGSVPGIVEAEQTTNLYLGNLSPEVTEEFLCQQFGKHGAIASVKIMYPRTDEEKSRGRNCGFVSFESRNQAESAKNTLDGADFYGMVIRIGWGKAVPKPVVAPTPCMAMNLQSTPVAGSSPGPASGFSDEPPEEKEVKVVRVPLPADKRKKMLIDLLAKYVAEEGHPFEQVIMEREPRNGPFSFMYEHDSQENMYYRWRVYAFGQGDTAKSWRTEPYRIYVGGSLWEPPSVDSPDGKPQKSNFSDRPPEAPPTERLVEERETTRSMQSGGQRLSDADRDYIEDMLRRITKARQSVCDAMTFCLDHSDSALEIAECVMESLTLTATQIDTKLGRLYLLSDILHNSSSSRPSAWAFRSAFEKYLPEIFSSFHQAYSNITGRLTAQQVREAVMKVLRVWESWAVYAPQYTRGLEATFLQQPSKMPSFVTDTTAAVNTTGELVDEDLDGELLDTSNELAKYPQWLRPSMQEWLSMDVSQLDRVCRQRGLPCNPQRDRAKMLQRLAMYEVYWQEKDSANQKPSYAFDPLARDHESLVADPNGPQVEAHIFSADRFADNSCSNITTTATPTAGVSLLLASSQLPTVLEQDGEEDEDDAKEGHDAEMDSDSSDDIFGEKDAEDEDIFGEESSAAQETSSGKPSSKKVSKAETEEQELRRSKLREVELEVTRMEVQLEREGLDKEAIKQKCHAKRQHLIQGCVPNSASKRRR